MKREYDVYYNYEVSLLAVDPEYQLRGHAKKLLTWSTRVTDTDNKTLNVLATREGEPAYVKVNFKAQDTMIFKNAEGHTPRRCWSGFMQYTPRSPAEVEAEEAEQQDNTESEDDESQEDPKSTDSSHSSPNPDSNNEDDNESQEDPNSTDNSDPSTQPDSDQNDDQDGSDSNCDSTDNQSDEEDVSAPGDPDDTSPDELPPLFTGARFAKPADLDRLTDIYIESTKNIREHQFLTSDNNDAKLAEDFQIRRVQR